ncbi:IMPACT family protein [Candidatus Neomarinimicrobiota bacterium]
MEKRYTLLEPTPQVEHRTRRSRFIARTLPATCQEEVREILRQVRELMPDATHICYAYRLMAQPGELQEFSTDAGEPSGSVGRPILNVLRQTGLVDVIACVARYFGGSKLGIPGLKEAYTRAVQMSLDRVKPTPWVAMVRVRLVLPYSLVDHVKEEVRRVAGTILNEEYAKAAALDLKVPQKEVRDFVRRLRDRSRGEIQISSDTIDFESEHA